jgi:hypothetical protein
MDRRASQIRRESQAKGDRRISPALLNKLKKFNLDQKANIDVSNLYDHFLKQHISVSNTYNHMLISFSFQICRIHMGDVV